MSTILIRQIPDDYADSTGLAKYNRSRMPGCKDRFSVALNTDGRYLTNLDEDSFTVPKDKKEEVKQKRENFQTLLGKDLTGTSSFWEEFNVVIDADKPKVFNTENPMDALSIHVLFANKYVAPSKELAYTPEYKDAQYYAYTEETEEAEEIGTRKKRDKALTDLLNISDDKDKMLLYGQYLEGLKYHNKLGENTLYKMLRTYIEDKDIKNATNFINALKKDPVELQQKIIVDKGLKQRLISKVHMGNKQYAYQYGNVTLGTTIEDVYKNLSLPEFAPELMSLKKELDK